MNNSVIFKVSDSSELWAMQIMLETTQVHILNSALNVGDWVNPAEHVISRFEEVTDSSYERVDESVLSDECDVSDSLLCVLTIDVADASYYLWEHPEPEVK